MATDTTATVKTTPCTAGTCQEPASWAYDPSQFSPFEPKFLCDAHKRQLEETFPWAYNLLCDQVVEVSREDTEEWAELLDLWVD